MISLIEARKELKRWQDVVRRLEDARCAKVGHRKGPGAWGGFSYCLTFGGQIENDQFGKPAKKV